MKNKKLFLFLPILISTLSLSACDLSFIDNLFANNSKDKSNADKHSSVLSIPNDTPQSWIDLFNFDNATIKCTAHTVGTNITYYKKVNSILYIKVDGEDYTEYLNPLAPFDYTYIYSKFTYNSINNTYTATGIPQEPGSAWLEDYLIYVNDNKISVIENYTYYASLSFTYRYEFYSYGTTTLE